MKETVYIGADFGVIPLIPHEGFTFEEEPCVVLFNRATQHYFAADDVVLSKGSAYVTFTKSVTALMSPGSYALEVYEDESKTNIIKYIEEYADAVLSSASPNSYTSES